MSSLAEKRIYLRSLLECLGDDLGDFLKFDGALLIYLKRDCLEKKMCLLEIVEEVLSRYRSLQKDMSERKRPRRVDRFSEEEQNTLEIYSDEASEIEKSLSEDIYYREYEKSRLTREIDVLTSFISLVEKYSEKEDSSVGLEKALSAWGINKSSLIVAKNIRIS